MFEVIRICLALLFALCLLAFAFLNLDPVSFRYFPMRAPVFVSLGLLGIVLVACGYVAGRFDAWLSFGPLSRKAREKRRTIRRLEKERKKYAAAEKTEIRTEIALPVEHKVLK